MFTLIHARFVSFRQRTGTRSLLGAKRSSFRQKRPSCQTCQKSQTGDLRQTSRLSNPLDPLVLSPSGPSFLCALLHKNTRMRALSSTRPPSLVQVEVMDTGGQDANKVVQHFGPLLPGPLHPRTAYLLLHLIAPQRRVPLHRSPDKEMKKSKAEKPAPGHEEDGAVIDITYSPDEDYQDDMPEVQSVFPAVCTSFSPRTTHTSLGLSAPLVHPLQTHMHPNPRCRWVKT